MIYLSRRIVIIGGMAYNSGEMITKQQGRFTLYYDALADFGRIFEGELLIGESPRPDSWIVKDARGWLELTHHRHRRERFGGDLRGWLQHVRAMTGVATDAFSLAHRALNAGQLRDGIYSLSGPKD